MSGEVKETPRYEEAVAGRNNSRDSDGEGSLREKGEPSKSSKWKRSVKTERKGKGEGEDEKETKSDRDGSTETPVRSSSHRPASNEKSPNPPKRSRSKKPEEIGRTSSIVDSPRDDLVRANSRSAVKPTLELSKQKFGEGNKSEHCEDIQVDSVDARTFAFDGHSVVDLVIDLVNETSGVALGTKDHRVNAAAIVDWLVAKCGWTREKAVDFGSVLIFNDILTGDKRECEFEDDKDTFYKFKNLFLLRHGKVSIRAKPKVVILGGGYAGSNVAKQLEKYHSRFDITLVDEKEYFENTIWVLRMMTEPAIDESVKLFRKLVLPHTRYLPKTRIINGKVLEVTPEKVILNNATLHFDYLVVATGASYETEDIKVSSSTTQQELFTDYRVKALSDIALKVSTAKRIAVVGGGAVGTELVGEITSQYPDKEVYFIHAHSHLLVRLDPAIGKAASKYLMKKGAKIILNERATAIAGSTKKATSLQLTNGAQLTDFDLVYWATGQRANTQFMRKNFASYLSDDRRVKLDGHENIFCIGDASAVNEEKKAERALAHAEIAVGHIVSLSKGKSLGKPYKVSKHPVFNVISLGRSKSILIINGRVISKGKLANLAKSVSFKTAGHQPASGSSQIEEVYAAVDLGLPKGAERPKVALLGAIESPERALLLAGAFGANDITVTVIKASKKDEVSTKKLVKPFEAVKNVALKDFDPLRVATLKPAILENDVCVLFMRMPFKEDLAQLKLIEQTLGGDKAKRIVIVSQALPSNEKLINKNSVLAGMKITYDDIKTTAEQAFEAVTLITFAGEFEMITRSESSKSTHAVLYPYGDEPLNWLSREDLVECVARTCLGPFPTPLLLTGEAYITSDEVLEGVSVAIGTEVEIKKLAVDDAVKQLTSKKTSDVLPDEVKSSILALKYGDRTLTKDAASILQRPMQTLGSWIEKHSHLFY